MTVGEQDKGPGRIIGLDIGSRTVDAVLMEDGRVVDSLVMDSGPDPQETAQAVARRLGAEDALVVATGYGRRRAKGTLAEDMITEIKAHALGAWSLFPDARAVLDVGGQDTKVIALGERGGVSDFEMNDKCAAGTGRFLEVMARSLGYSLEEMAVAAARGRPGLKISSMCTVFAESEVTTLVHRGEEPDRIARALCESIEGRALGMLRRVGVEAPLVFTGGVARNTAIVEMLVADFGGPVYVPENPQLTGALGAALHGLSLLAVGAGAGRQDA